MMDRDPGTAVWPVAALHQPRAVQRKPGMVARAMSARRQVSQIITDLIIVK